MAHVALVSHPDFRDHHTGLHHPECVDRYDAVLEGLYRAGLMEHMTHLEPKPASLDTLRLAHARLYVRMVEEQILAGQLELSTGDTAVCPASWHVGRLAAGGAVRAVRAVLDGRVDRAFVAARPPGHHAGPATGMGFCIFNNVAVAARYARRVHGLDRVLIVDWDVHHGNGTQDIFYDDDSVFYFSVHQSPWYPGTGHRTQRGHGKGVGTTLNCPLPEGTGGAEILSVLERELKPAAEEFRPQLILLSAGFDSRAGDPLGMFRCTDEDFAELTRFCCALAREHAGGRVVSILEGGYDLDGLGAAAAAHVRGLMEGA